MKLEFFVTTFLALMLIGCTPVPILPKKAIIEPKVVYDAIDVEKQLNERKGVEPPQGEKWFSVFEGSIPVIITAPHSTRPLREGKRRFSDGGGTAALALAIGKQTGAYVIYTTFEGPSDPNFYDDNLFKVELSRLIDEVSPLYVLDFHGSHPYRSYDIDFGTMQGLSLLGKDWILFDLIKELNNEGLNSISYNRFGASNNETITKFVHGKGVPAIQMEINSTYITPSKGHIEAQRFSRLLQAISRFVEDSM